MNMDDFDDKSYEHMDDCLYEISSKWWFWWGTWDILNILSHWRGRQFADSKCDRHMMWSRHHSCSQSLGYAQFADLKARLLAVLYREQTQTVETCLKAIYSWWIFHVYPSVSKYWDGQSIRKQFHNSIKGKNIHNSSVGKWCDWKPSTSRKMRDITLPSDGQQVCQQRLHLRSEAPGEEKHRKFLEKLKWSDDQPVIDVDEFFLDDHPQDSFQEFGGSSLVGSPRFHDWSWSKEARDVAQQALEGQLRGISAWDNARCVAGMLDPDH